MRTVSARVRAYRIAATGRGRFARRFGVSRGGQGPSLTVTLIAAGAPEEAQATWWRPLSWKWPGFAAPPSLQVLDWESAVDPETKIAGSVVLAAPACGSDARLYALLSRLEEMVVPAVVLHEAGGGRIVADENFVPMARDAEPALIACVLAALGARQLAVESLRAEARVARRFNGGLQGEIEKIHDELQLAASVQREFLPRTLPAARDLEMQVLFRPCGYVSGDIYDAQRLDENHIGFFVADAVGHGVPAALMTMVLCRCLHTVERHSGGIRIVSPGEALRRLNRDLIDQHGEGARFATAVYGVIDTRARHVTLAGAGHPYPLRIRGGRVDRAETTGGLLGLDANDQFDETSFTLDDGEMLVVYSDGFETAFPAPGVDDYGRRLPNRNYVERFVDLTRAWRERGLGRAVGTLMEQIDEQAGSLHQADDLTALIIAHSREDPLEHLLRGGESESAPKERSAEGARVEGL